MVTQATDNSIPFYERLGFVRVGAVTTSKREDHPQRDEDEDEWEPKGGGGGTASNGKKRKSKQAPPKSPWICSPHTVYRTATSDETVETVAKEFGVPAFDVLFLNAARYPKLTASAPLKKETKLLLPAARTAEQVRAEIESAHDKFFIVPEDMPFKRAAEILGKDPRELLAANLGRQELRGLQVSSELLAGTKLQTNRAELAFDEYCHWTFADDDPAKGEPSYMMARRLKPIDERGPPSSSSRITLSEVRRSYAQPTSPGPHAPLVLTSPGPHAPLTLTSPGPHVAPVLTSPGPNCDPRPHQPWAPL